MSSEDQHKYYSLLKSSEDSTKNVPKICLLPQSSLVDHDSKFSSILSSCTGYKSSNRDSGNFDALFTGSKVNINNQIKTVHNWFKHLPGSDQTRLIATLLPSVHFDYMAMISSLAHKQTKFISDEVLDYQNLEEESNNLQSLINLDEEPSILAVNLLSRLPLLYPCEIVANQTVTNHRTSSLAVHKMYAKLLTKVFSQDFSDVEEMLAVKQLATITAHHPNLLPQLQNKLIELSIERLLLDERGDVKRPRRPGALSPFGPPGQMTQTQSFSLLVPPFLAASCLSASASPQSVCSYNSSGFHSGAESSSRRNNPPLSPQSSTSSCGGDDNSILPHSASCDYEMSSLQPPNDGSSSSNGEGRSASLQGQSSIDTPTPSSASSVMLVTRQIPPNSPNSVSLELVKSPDLSQNFNEFKLSFFRDDEVDSEINFPIKKDLNEGGRNSFTEGGSGMSYVPSWLKSLRLHKYASLFQQLNYQEMLNITEEWLESKNVTKGARNKILVNIHKLESRQCILREIESDFISSGSLASMRACLNEIRYVLSTPIKPFSDDISGYVVTATSGIDSPPDSVTSNVANGDLPGQVIRCLSRVCSNLLVTKKVDEESYSLFLHIIDLILEHESFTGRHKNLCISWRNQLEGNRAYPRKSSYPWGESQRSSYRKCGRPQSSTQACNFHNMRPIQNTSPSMDQYCSVSSASFSVPPNLVCQPLPYGDMSQFSLPILPIVKQQQVQDLSSQAVMKRQVERTLSAPNQSALMDLFLQCQSFPTTIIDTTIQKTSSAVKSIPLIIGTSTNRIIPSWSLNPDLTTTDSAIVQVHTCNDSSPNGSQDPTTAEINRNLDLLAREVTELAIRDPDSPDL